MSEIRCFLVEPVDVVRLSLRRYQHDFRVSSCPNGYHDATVYFRDVANVPLNRDSALTEEAPPQSDPRWPVKCSHCDYVFVGDTFQLFEERLYKRSDTGVLVALRDRIPGMMWDATWLHNIPDWCGPDGKSYQVVLPNGWEWSIDSCCSNCDMVGQEHKCWVRHGVAPNLTVDKNAAAEGIRTCGAGAGSILACKGTQNEWHGFLTNGVLRSC